MRYDRLLEGKIAVVTSGAHGMGKYISYLFAKHGATCIILGRDPSGEESAVRLRTISPESFFVQCDMSQKDDVERFIDTALTRAGGVDVVINNVGINQSDYTGHVENARFEYTQQVNLRGVIRLSRGFIPGMIARGGGSFVHISTIHSVSGGLMPNTAYSSSKSAINAFSNAIAVDFGKYNIRSNVVAPGGVMTRERDADFWDLHDNDPVKLREWIRNGEAWHADFGNGSPYDIAHACLFLSSPIARRVTGALVMSDGGSHYMAHKFLERRFAPDDDDLWMDFAMNMFEEENISTRKEVLS